MSFTQTLAAAHASPFDAQRLAQLASAALDEQEEECALPLLTAGAAQHRTDPGLWQWLGLLHRSLDQRHLAIPAFDMAAKLAPNDVRIAHSRARVALEAGLPSVALFDEALRLEPMSGEILLGRGAALFADGQGQQAIAHLDSILTQHPGWHAGQVDLAQLRWLMGDCDGFVSNIEHAVAALPKDVLLWQILIQKRMEAKDYAAALEAISRATASIGDHPFLLELQAATLTEAGELARADAAFARIGAPTHAGLAMWLVRHELRSQRLDRVTALLDHWLKAREASIFWPYAATVWRMTGDKRYDWLEGDSRLISVVDIADKLPPLGRLAEVLRGLHHARAQHLDQSVRGGTQTDGALFFRIEPEIRALRAAIVDAVAAHIAQLPPRDPAHPTFAPRRDKTPRFAGSWSVRLPSQGFHSNHIHQTGWLSSALYVALPETMGTGGQNDGWFSAGEPQAELGLDVKPFRLIEPKVGTLILFPSTMWHGTIPFESGERLTVAFDVMHPLDPG